MPGSRTVRSPLDKRRWYFANAPSKAVPDGLGDEEAIRAIWACWNDGTKLDFHGEFYTHTLMTPFFNPGPNPHGDARIFLAGVGELMTEVAGEVANGFICHGFTTRRYLDEVTLPHLEKGRAKAGKSMDGFELMGPMFVVTGRDETEMAKAAEASTKPKPVPMIRKGSNWSDRSSAMGSSSMDGAKPSPKNTAISK